MSTANKKADKVKRITAHYHLTNDKVAKQMSNDSDSKSASEYMTLNLTQMKIMMMKSCQSLMILVIKIPQLSLNKADDAREAVVHSKLSRSGRRVGSWMDRFQDSYM